MSVRAVGFLDLESPEVESGLFVRKDVEVYAVDAWQEEVFASAPFAEEVACRQFVGERVIHQYPVGHHEGGHLFEPVEHALRGFGLFVVGQQALACSDRAADVILFHFASVCS